MEFRPAVIRRAMNRSAAPLATSHLHHPDNTIEKKLASVVTIGYRLLDPRRREDALHRMMLGRIHPQLADEAVRIAQSKGNQLTEIESAEGNEATHFISRGLLKPQGHARTQTHRSHPHNCFLNDETSLWNDSLRSHDLLVERPMKRLYRTTRRWAVQHYIAVASVSGLVLLMIGTWRIGRNDDVIAVVEASPDVDLARLPEPPRENTIAREAASITVPESPPKSADEATLATVQLASRPVVVASFVNAIIAAEADEGVDIPMLVMAADVSAIAAVEESKVERVPPEASKQPAPLAADLVLRQDAWKLSQATLPDNDWQAKIERSVKFANDAVEGSNDQWIGLRGAALFAVLSGKYAEADRLMLRMTDAFQTDLAILSKDVATQCGATPVGVGETSNVMHWLEAWFGRSLLAGQLDDAAFFALHFDQVANSLSDRAMADRSKEMAGSLETALRLAETTERIELLQDESASASERLAAGRYWGLIRQQWIKALPHLAAGNDARLAGLAASESLLGGLPKPIELIALAEGYLALARKSKGWQQTSYILHANEILHRDTSSEIHSQSLELGRVQKQLLIDHEAVFAMADLLVVAKPVIAKPIKLTSPILDAKSDVGMLGRIRVGSEDVGVLLRYEPGAKLTIHALEQLATQLKTDLTGASIELVGTISVNQPTAISIEAPSVGVDGKASVSLDGHDLVRTNSPTAVDTTSVFQTDLAPGQWTIRWSIPSINILGSTLRVTDSLSRIPINVEAPLRTIQDHPGTLPTRFRVSIVPSSNNPGQ